MGPGAQSDLKQHYSSACNAFGLAMMNQIKSSSTDQSMAPAMCCQIFLRCTELSPYAISTAEFPPS